MQLIPGTGISGESSRADPQALSVCALRRGPEVLPSARGWCQPARSPAHPGPQVRVARATQAAWARPPLGALSVDSGSHYFSLGSNCRAWTPSWVMSHKINQGNTLFLRLAQHHLHQRVNIPLSTFSLKDDVILNYICLVCEFRGKSTHKYTHAHVHGYARSGV